MLASTVEGPLSRVSLGPTRLPDVPLQQLDVVELSACGKDGEGVV